MAGSRGQVSSAIGIAFMDQIVARLFDAAHCGEQREAAGVLAEEIAHGNEATFPPSRESDSIGLAGSIDSAAPTARRYQMTRRETPTVFPTIGVFTVALRK
jgi:hypothetical protein